MFAAPEMKANDSVALPLPAPTIEGVILAIAISVSAPEIRDLPVLWEDIGPLGVFQESGRHERAPRVA